MSAHEQHFDAAAYLLGELSADERAAFERALADDAALRAEVEALRPVVARLDALEPAAWEDGPEPPPLRLPPGALGAPEPTAAARKARPQGGRRSWRRWLQGPFLLRPAFAALGAAALLAGGIAIGVVVDGGGGTDAPPVQAQTLPLQPLAADPAAHGEALVGDPDASEVTLQLGGLPQSRAGEYYEAWLLGDDGRMISIGSFRVGADGRATVQLPLPVSPSSYQFFDISVEREDEGPEHSGDSVLRGATSA